MPDTFTTLYWMKRRNLQEHRTFDGKTMLKKTWLRVDFDGKTQIFHVDIPSDWWFHTFVIFHFIIMG